VNAPRAAFRTYFGSQDPSLVVTVPGRVNLIGDHIDYAGLSVLPMAIQRHVHAVARPRTDRTVRLANVDPAFGPRAFEISPGLLPGPRGDWGNYVQAAIVHLERQHGPLSGFDALIDSTLPVATGLSSSSAMVIVGALSALAASGVELPPLELAHELAEAERYVGTRGGGMDQAICLGARAGCASRVDFDPLALTPVAVPLRWRFVIASSLVRAEKAGAARAAYNARRRDVEQAVSAVARALGEAEVVTPRQLAHGYSTEELIEASAQVLSDVPQRRLRHVLTEATRVHRAVQALESEDASLFGSLMYRSHDSLRDDFDVSCPELDRLVELAATAGADGARLTGAGFGGSAVILCDVDRTQDVLRTLADRFYRGRCSGDALDDALFVAEPSAGASVSRPTEAP
jgi:galactokinase